MQNPSRDLLFDYLPVPAAARALHVHPHTLKRWRWRSYGPQPVKVGGRLFYRVSDIEGWLASLGEGGRATA
ncbi:helix-turn-helix transcriptional regulator [Arenimonas alkanexedens]